MATAAVQGWVDVLWRPIEALHRAAETDNAAKARAVLAIFGASVINTSRRIHRGEIAMTPLHRAALHGHAQLARLLLAAGAAVETENERGRSRHLAGGGGERRVRVPLRHTSCPPLPSPGPCSGPAPPQRVCASPAPLPPGDSPLADAAALGRAVVCSLLLDHRAKVNAVQSDGLTPLHLAAARGCPATVKLLLMHGADSHALTPSGYSALHLAARIGSRDTLATLLAFEPSLDISLQAHARGPGLCGGARTMERP